MRTPVPCPAGTVYIHKDQASQAAFHPPYLSLKHSILDIDTQPIFLSSIEPIPRRCLPGASSLTCVCERCIYHHPSFRQVPPWSTAKEQRSPCHVPGNSVTLSPWDLADKSHLITHTHTHTGACTHTTRSQLPSGTDRESHKQTGQTHTHRRTYRQTGT